jgi:hypothetical protein
MTLGEAHDDAVGEDGALLGLLVVGGMGNLKSCRLAMWCSSFLRWIRDADLVGGQLMSPVLALLGLGE